MVAGAVINNSIAVRTLLMGAATLLASYNEARATEAPASPTQQNTKTSYDKTDHASLEEIVVVATKYESSLRDIAADVVVVTDEDLMSTLSTSLEDIFRFVPGITHQSSGSRFGADGLSVRGIGGNRVAIELDGVPVSDQFDIGRFASAGRDFVDTGFVERVEVLRGPASALYGSSALGGVVAMRTLNPETVISEGDTGGRSAALFRSNDNSTHLQSSLARSGNHASVLVGLSYREGSERESALGNSDQQDYERAAGMLKVAGDNRLGHRWQISAITQQREAQTAVKSVLGEGRFRTTTRLDGDDEYNMDLISAEYGFGSDAHWVTNGTLRVFHSDADITQHTVDERGAAQTPVRIDRLFFYDQRLSGAELNLWRDLEVGQWDHRFGLGLEWTERKTREMRDGLSTNLLDGTATSSVLGEDFPLRDFPITKTRERSAYVTDELRRGPLTVILAARLDDNQLTPEADSIYQEDNPSTGTVAVSESDVSPKLGAIYRVNPDTDVYVQYARGFRAPPFEDANIGLDIPLFNIRAIPNPDLKSETSEGWELGMRWYGARSQFQLGLFQTEYRDFIETKRRIGIDALSGRLLFQSQNIDRARIRGIEANWSTELTGTLEGFSLQAAGYWGEGDNQESGQPLNSVGPAQAVLGASWHSPTNRTRVQALLTATTSWNRRDESGGDLFEPPGYAVVDVYFNHQIGDHITARGGVANVADRVYWHWSEVRGLAPAEQALATLAAAGRNYSLGLQWDW